MLTRDVLRGLHDEYDRYEEREDFVRKAREEEYHVGQREHASQQVGGGAGREQNDDDHSSHDKEQGRSRKRFGRATGGREGGRKGRMSGSDLQMKPDRWMISRIFKRKPLVVSCGSLV